MKKQEKEKEEKIKNLVRRIKFRVDNIMYGKRRKMSTKFYYRHEREKITLRTLTNISGQY